MAVALNGQDVRTSFGLMVQDRPKWRSGASRTLTSVTVDGRWGVVPYRVRESSRDIQMVGTMVQSTHAALLTAERAWKAVSSAGAVEIVWTSGAQSQRINGIATGELTVVGASPAETSRFATVQATFTCPDPVWLDTQPTVLSLATATRRNIELGEAPSPYIIRIMGSATNPTVEYRDASGAVVWSLAFTVTLASTDYLELDSRTGLITKYASGVASDGIALLNSGSQAAWPSPIDPHDGDTTTSQWPTIGPSAGTGELLYWKAWL